MCYKCQRAGHIAKFCTASAGSPRSPPPVNGGKTITCYKCGGPNHLARSVRVSLVHQSTPTLIMAGRSTQCTAAGPAVGGAHSRSPRKCYECDEMGHIARDCPSRQLLDGDAPATLATPA